ncbi:MULTISPECIES: RICIN domain-containing protein [Streptomyces]|uniref:RICIN domain-containing protein n=1 Tax=Streptomyces TaxID=1883 RepID=UPI0004AA6E8F|nr:MULTISPECIES: RICIN domain-containing protein [Streptomyces]
MRSTTRTRTFLATLGAVAAVAGAAVVGTPAAQAAQAGACDLGPALHTPGKVYNGAAGVLDLPNNDETNGRRIGVYAANDQSTAQTWSFWAYCDGTTAISHGGDGKLVDLDTRSGAVQLWDTPGGWDGLNRPAGDWMPANQKWRLTDEDRGWYLIRNAATGQCLTSAGVAQYTSMTGCNPADPAQRWMA